jgi:hypothetical protein
MVMTNSRSYVEIASLLVVEGVTEKRREVALRVIESIRIARSLSRKHGDERA